MTLFNNIKSKLQHIVKSGVSTSSTPAAREERYFGRADESNKPCVSGWVSYTDESCNPVSLKITKGNEVKFVTANIERDDVLKTGRVRDARCGYSVNFSQNNYAEASIEVLLPIGRLTNSLPAYKNRKVFFIHIPKAAGSSVNDCITSSIDGAYYTHIEGLRSQWNEIKDSAFLSGHIRYVEYETNFSQHDYVVFAFLREPFSHLKSHMNWVRRLAEPELISKRESHSDIVHKIADELAQVDFSDIKQIKSYVANLKPIAYGLFDNCQVRYLSDVKPNELVTKKHLDQAIKNLQHLHFVGISEHSKESQSQLMSLLGLQMNFSEAKSNVNLYDYGLNLNNSKLAEELKPLVQFDLELYRVAKERFLNSNVC